MKNLTSLTYKYATKLHNLFSLRFYFAFLIVLSVFIFFSQKTLAQAQFNLRLQTGFPLEEFAKKMNLLLLELGECFLFQLKQKNLWFQ